MTTPSIDALASYGGPCLNYAAPEDPTTDRDALLADKWYASTAGLTHTTPLAWVRISTSSTTPTILSSDVTWQSGAAITVGRVNVGIYLITLPTSVVDWLGVTQAPNYRAVDVMPERVGGSIALVQGNLSAANTVAVNVWNSSFALTDFGGLPILVTIY